MFKSGKPEKGSSKLYDGHITTTIPYYETFNLEMINLIRATGREPGVWLDTGCGTGNLVNRAAKVFPRTKFILADPSVEMLQEAERKLRNHTAVDYCLLDPCATQEIDLTQEESMDVITAILCHHYLDKDGRKNATERCFHLLKSGGLYITFENVRPLTERGIEIALKNWKRFQMDQGKYAEAAGSHIKRFGIEYYPITIKEHLSLLKGAGFQVVELLWFSYVQAGFYAVK